ncbi:HNH endonuclease [Caloranaerobacter azorensis]|uniref:HNH nuclease domain-containing protein n=1 Tax=Caloranaerobacter azorensis TaxID=116090 RepID=A0A6P1YAI9_9FIRM|nr:HNH endonuclease [Caloranaerobacter azorensis]QIB25882.1 hypothetical protein G3A45_00200 [Caloranaerobacter azorensis]
MPAKDQKVTHDNDKITIYRPSFKSLAFATYNEDLFRKISSVTWYVVRSNSGKEYLKSDKYGLLHQLVFRHFYGEDVLNKAYENGYVIDHLDNDGYMCVYENLALIPKKENSAKGFTYDIEREEAIDNFSINITRDMKTKEFQISIAFNKPANLVLDNKIIPLSTLYLRYGTDFKTVFLDARSIINDLNTVGKINFANLRNTGYDYRKAEIIFSNYKEVETGIIVRNGKIYFVQDSPKIKLIKPAHNKELHKRHMTNITD